MAGKRSGKRSSSSGEFDDLVKSFRDLRQEVAAASGVVSRFGGGLAGAAGALGRGVGGAVGAVAGVVGAIPQIAAAQNAAVNIGSNLALSAADRFVRANAQSGSDLGMVGRFRSFLGGVVAEDQARAKLADVAENVSGDPEFLRTIAPIIHEQQLRRQAARRAAEDESTRYIATDGYKQLQRMFEQNILRPR